MELGIIDVTAGNLEREHICCAIGNDADNKARAAAKKALPSPFGIVSAFLGEELLAWEPMPAGRFKALLEKRRA